MVAVQPAAELAGQADQLPVEIPLGKEFVFRSVFACPVSREQVSGLTNWVCWPDSTELAAPVSFTRETSRASHPKPPPPQSTPENPPMMLPCGHCMCKQSILKIAKATNRAFKCPYCPQEATVVQCRQLVL